MVRYLAAAVPPSNNTSRPNDYLDPDSGLAQSADRARSRAAPLPGTRDPILQRNLTCQSVTVANGALDGTRLVGRFSQSYDFRGFPNPGDKLAIKSSGRFEALLA